MKQEWEIGDFTYLKEPFKGYSHVEIAGFDGVKLVVCISSGYELTVYEDELEDKN